MKTKDKLLLFLALNAISSPLLGVTPKYEKLYDKMTKKLEKGKSNDETYKLLNQILAKRNKELNDLYVQNDYIIKPEYLEWQIFFSDFYSNNKRSGSKERRILSHTTGEGKSIDLGVFIPVKGINKNEINLNISPIEETTININTANIELPDFDIPDFNADINLPEVSVLKLGSYSPLRMKQYYSIGRTTQLIAYNTSGDSIYDNLNVKALTPTQLVINGNTHEINVEGEVNYYNGGINQTVGLPYKHTGFSNNSSIINISNNGNYNIEGNWNFNVKQRIQGDSFGFLSYRPYYIDHDGEVVFSGNLVINSNEGWGINQGNLVGLSMDLNNINELFTGKATLKNQGDITINSSSRYFSSIGMQLEPSSSTYAAEGEMINAGTITINGESYSYGGVGIALFHYTDTNTNKVLVKTGNINVLGSANVGVLTVGRRFSTGPMILGESNITIDGNDGVLYVAGRSNAGLVVRTINAPKNETNGLKNFKNFDIRVDGENNTGIYIGYSSFSGRNMIIDDSVVKNLEFVETSVNSSLITSESNGTRGINTVLDSSLLNSLPTFNKGSFNTFAVLTLNSQVTNYVPITIEAGATAMTAFSVDSSGKLINYADIINNSSAGYYTFNGKLNKYGGVGIAIYTTEGSINKGNINMNGEKAIGLFIKGNINSENDHIISNGDRAVAVYGEADSSRRRYRINLVSNNLEVNGNNGVVLYSKGADIVLGTLNGAGTLNLTANGNNTYAFYNTKYTDYYGTLDPKIYINGNVNAKIQNGAIALNYFGDGIYDSVTGSLAPPIDISNELTKIIDTTNGKLNLTVDSDSYNIVVLNAPITLSGLENLDSQNINFFSNSSKNKLYQGALYIDTDSNLDVNNNIGDKKYRDLETVQSSITVNSGISISGSEDSLLGVAQSSKYNEIEADIVNNGMILLTGNDSKGIYNKRGSINSTNLIEISGENGVGLYGTFTDITNTGIINIGNKGTGIYGETYIDAADNPNNDILTTNIYNDGIINAIGTNGAIGIYGNNNAESGMSGNLSINLGNNTNINMKNSEKSIGIYAKNASLVGSGTISVGKDSYGIYLNNGDANLNDLTLNLTGDDTVGVYTDGTNTFSGNGTINIDGKGIVVFNIASSGSFNQNFNVNSTAGSTYILQNLNNTTLYSNGIFRIDEGGIFLSGTNSAVLLGEDSDINSFNTTTNNFDSNIIGITLSGGNFTGLPVLINGEMMMQEATNRGLMTFGNNSSGIYVTDGASALNEGTITLGTDSVGIYGKGTNTNISNTGLINIEDNSVGMLLNNGNNSVNSGTIEGNGERVIGMYSDSVNNSIISNMNKITLSGNRVIGAYLSGQGSQIFSNNGIISVGNSNSALDPSIGIYNKSSTNTINNNGVISAGEQSIGIYNKGGEVNQNSGSINVSKDGVGIYSESGNLNLNSGTINVTGENGIGIYGINGMVLKNNSVFNIADNSYGMVVSSNSSIENRGTAKLGENSVFMYSDGASEVTNNLGADIEMTGSDSVAFYMTNGGSIKNYADIEADKGHSNIGIYNKSGSIENTGNIKIGDSLILNPEDPFANNYSVGVYGENTVNVKNSGDIEIGANAVGFYTKGNLNEALNTGNITSTKESAIGLYLENGSARNEGNITLSGEQSIGIAATKNVNLTNAGIITMNGSDSIGIYANTNSKIINESTGIININGNNSIGVQLSGGSTLENYGTISLANGLIGSKDIITGDPVYVPPSIINAGVIKVDEKFEIDGVNLTIKVDPSTLKVPTLSDIEIGGYAPEDIDAGFLMSNSVTIKAPNFDLGGNAVKIDPLFTQGTNKRVYKFENVFDPTTPEGGPNTGEVGVESGSLTFDAIPVANKTTGAIDIWMEKINYSEFTKGNWQNEFAENIERNYLDATGEALQVYDKLDLIGTESALNNSFNQLAGDMYANMMQREEDISRIFTDNLRILQNSENNTKENVKIGVIAGKGKTKEDTSGVQDYDYNTYGVLALREVERTYRHKFGYSLGYTQTNFEFENNNSEDRADTIQVGLHNKYRINKWNFRTDLLGRMSMHSVDRNVIWQDGEKSELSADYNAYGVSLLNEVGKSVSLGRNIEIEPFAGLELGYKSHSSFTEKNGKERLKLDSNETYNVKPSVGVRVSAGKEIKNTGWKLKGNMGAAYEYELGNTNRQEKASLAVMEEGYHKLAKTKDEDGLLKLNVSGGIEYQDRYGIYVTGEYGTNMDDKESHRVGLNLKASF